MYFIQFRDVALPMLQWRHMVSPGVLLPLPSRWLQNAELVTPSIVLRVER